MEDRILRTAFHVRFTLIASSDQVDRLVSIKKIQCLVSFLGQIFNLTAKGGKSSTDLAPLPR